MTLFPVLVDVYHKETLVTKEEALKALSSAWWWEKLAVAKDSVMATRIANVLDKSMMLHNTLEVRTLSVYTFAFISTVWDPLKSMIILNIICMLHSFISCTHCMCACTYTVYGVCVFLNIHTYDAYILFIATITCVVLDTAHTIQEIWYFNLMHYDVCDC